MIKKINRAINYFHNELKNSSIAKDYLKSRGVSKESVKKYMLGYAPPTPKICKRFHDRITFPIWFPFGAAAGWTSRTLIDAPAKYLNVKESAEFQKSRLLYLYNFAKKAIIKTGVAILVEGQMDALILRQYGILNTVASSGVSFKPAAARILSRYAKKVYVIFDADNAGNSAQVKARKYLEEIYSGDLKIQVVIVNLPEGEDPASFMIKFGKEKFISYIKEYSIA